MTSATRKTDSENPVTAKVSGLPVIVVGGPTASGKSALALDIAHEFNGVVINADSMQVYDELRILTARPSVEDERRVEHRLYGVLSPAKACSVGQWRELAVREIESTHASGRLPVVAGGTGMYIRGLMHGLAPIPQIPPNIRSDVQDIYRKQGGDAALAALAVVDPETAGRLASGDQQRVIRALEVYRATGRSLSHWIAAGNQGALAHAAFQAIVLQPPRAALYEHIDDRFHQMIDEGALEEVKRVRGLGLNPELPAMKAVGLRELGRYLDGEQSLDEAIADAQQASRNYAKRQLTWFRNQIPEAESYFAQYSESVRPKIFSFIRQFLLTNPL